MRDDVWGRLHETEAFLRAQRVIAAGIGADNNPQPLLDELQGLALWAAGEFDPNKGAPRITYLASAFAVLAKSSLELSAEFVEQIQAGTLLTEDATVDPERLRNTMLELLEQHAQHLREQLD